MTKAIDERNNKKNDTPESSEVKKGCGKLLVDARQAADMLGICRTTWLTLYQTGQTPEPVRIGRRVLWRVIELQAWVDAGCPTRYHWKWKGAGV